MTTPTLLFEPRRAKRAALLIVLASVFFVGLELTLLRRVDACLVALLIPLAVVVAFCMVTDSPAAPFLSWLLVAGFILGGLAGLSAVATTLSMRAIGVALIPLGLLCAAFVVVLVRVARVGPEEASLFFEPIGGPLTPSVRKRIAETQTLPIPEASLDHPASAQLFDRYFEHVEEQWHGVAEEARRLNLLPLYVDVGGWVGLRRDGIAIEVSWWEDGTPTRLAEHRLKIAALAAASRKHYPEAAQMLPRRPVSAKSCRDCTGEGQTEVFGFADRLPCGTCLGLGWRAS